MIINFYMHFSVCMFYFNFKKCIIKKRKDRSEVKRKRELGQEARTLYFIYIPIIRKASVQSVAQSCPTLRDPMDCSPPGSSVHGILQARTLEWVAIPFSRGSSQPRDWTWVSCIAGRFFTIWATREAPNSNSNPQLLTLKPNCFPLYQVLISSSVN